MSDLAWVSSLVFSRWYGVNEEVTVVMWRCRGYGDGGVALM